MNCDIAIIGAGPGGLSVASVAAQLGLKVVLVESGKMGGDCLNYGCIPSKSFIAAAKAAHTFTASNALGINSIVPPVSFDKVMDHVASVIKKIAIHDSIERFSKLGVEVIQGSAQFKDNHSIIVNETLIAARQFIIATGSSLTIPPIPGLESTAYLTNETIFNLREKPQHLIVIGAGPIGCELAQGFHFLGVKVTLLEALTMMPHDEPDLVTILREKFKADGISLYEHCKITQVHTFNDGVDLTIQLNNEEKVIRGSHLLVATGRHANVENLDLENAGINFDAKGIKVNCYMQTSNKKVYAIGDVTGGLQFTHIANYHAGIVIRNAIFKMRAKANNDAAPWVTYTTPELAHCGMLASNMKELAPDAQILELPFTSNDRAQTELETLGKIKVIVSKKGVVLGCSILGPQAGELILPWIMLIKNKNKLRELTDVIIPYPTLNEISKRVASEYYASALFSNKVKMIVSWLKYLG